MIMTVLGEQGFYNISVELNMKDHLYFRKQFI